MSDRYSPKTPQWDSRITFYRVVLGYMPVDCVESEVVTDEQDMRRILNHYNGVDSVIRVDFFDLFGEQIYIRYA